MSTKVISAKVSEDDYDTILDACNTKGCTISQFVKDACVVAIGKGSEFSESGETIETKTDNNKISELENKITRLEIQLSDARNTISKQNHEIKEFYELFSRQEIVNKRICRESQRMKMNCFKI